MKIIDVYLEYIDNEDDEDVEDQTKRKIMDITPKQATAQQKTGHPSLPTEPGGQEIRLGGRK